MATPEPDYPTRISIEEDDSPTNAFISRHRCCFHFPCFGSPPTTTTTTPTRLGGPTNNYSSPSTTSLWDRVRDGESDNKWWAKPIKAFKKLREWSEIVAGPKWKTFIRRFNRNRNRHNHQAVTAGKFQYDPLSYALNFDEGHNGQQHGQFEDEYGQFPDFSSRFASVPLSAKSSMDLGRGGAPAG